MPKVQLPPGCRSLQFQDGSRAVAAREGGYVNVTEGHARAIDQMAGNGDAGLLTGQFRSYGGTKSARVCSCGPTRWNNWTKTCPKCGAATEPE